MMKHIYIVMHFHEIDEFEEIDDAKTIGYYTTREKAEAAVSRASKLEGFRDCLDGFRIFETELDRDGWETGYITIPLRDE